MIHDLKIKLKFYNAILDGKKTFEVRNDDRGYNVGDYIRFVAVEGGSIYLTN